MHDECRASFARDDLQGCEVTRNRARHRQSANAPHIRESLSDQTRVPEAASTLMMRAQLCAHVGKRRLSDELDDSGKVSSRLAMHRFSVISPRGAFDDNLAVGRLTLFPRSAYA